jgi:hypothetical protein
VSTIVSATVTLAGAAGVDVKPFPSTPDPATDFSLYWMLNTVEAPPGELPSNLSVAVGLLSGPERMEADIDWGDTTAARVMMTISFGIEHLYHESGINTVTVTAGQVSHTITVYPGSMTLTLTPKAGDPMTVIARTATAAIDCSVDWGDGVVATYTAAQLNAGVQHTYGAPVRAIVSVTPAGWPNVNGAMAKQYFYANEPPTLTAVSPTSAKCADTVTFTGTYLDSVTLEHLYVGGHEFLQETWSSTATQITTQVPVEAQYLIGQGAQDVVVVNAAGNYTLHAALTITG